MSTHKRIDIICVAAIVFSLLVAIVFMNGEKLGIKSIKDEDAEANESATYFTENDLDADWDTTGATVITLNGDSADIGGADAYMLNGDVVIGASGKYVIRGNLTDGSIKVDVSDLAKVWILLDGVNINTSDDACIRIEEADKTFITLAKGSENTLVSGETMSEEAEEDGTDGVIFAHDDLTINGSGKLTVTAKYKHGIAANDDLIITGGIISVTAPSDAIHANDSVRVTSAEITTDAGDDGIVSDNADGYMYIKDGTFNIKSEDDGIHSGYDIQIDGGTLTVNAGDDGIHSETSIVINGGTINVEKCYEGIEAVNVTVNSGDVTIYCSDDGINAGGGSSDTGFGMPGNFSRESTTGEDGETAENTFGTPPDSSDGTFHGTPGEQMTDENGETVENQGGRSFGMRGGFKSEDMTDENGEAVENTFGTPPDFSDGTFPGMPGEQATDENGETVENQSGRGFGMRGGFKPEDMTDENGETITPENFRRGQKTGENGEAVTEPDMSNGKSTVSDAGAQEDSDEEKADTSNLETAVTINGGTIRNINENGRDSDGIDSNGSIYINGGYIMISLSGNGGNCALDFGTENQGICEINGGTVIACGSSTMLEKMSGTSKQVSVMYGCAATGNDTKLTVRDKNGKVLTEETVPVSFTNAVISSPDFELNGTYTIDINGESEEITITEIAGSYGTSSSGTGFTGGMNGMNRIGGESQTAETETE